MRTKRHSGTWMEGVPYLKNNIDDVHASDDVGGVGVIIMGAVGDMSGLT